MTTVGSQLRQARTEQKLSFAEVTQKTKIQPWVLEALEADRLQEMMSPIYVKGFLTTYAKCLHLEPEPLLQQIPWPEPPPVQEELPPPPAPATPISFRLPEPLRRRLGAALALGVLLIGVASLHPLRRLSQLRWPAFQTASATKATSEKGDKNQSAASSKTAGRQTAANQSPTATAKPLAATVTPPLKLASIAPVSDSIKPAEQQPLTVTPIQLLELEISANRTTWIKVRADGKLLSQQRLPRGAKERWTAKKSFELIVAKPSQIDLVLNGQPISPFAVAHQGRLLITHRGVSRLPEEN